MKAIDMFPIAFVFTVFLTITGRLAYQYIQAAMMDE